MNRGGEIGTYPNVICPVGSQEAGGYAVRTPFLPSKEVATGLEGISGGGSKYFLCNEAVTRQSVIDIGVEAALTPYVVAFGRVDILKAGRFERST